MIKRISKRSKEQANTNTLLKTLKNDNITIKNDNITIKNDNITINKKLDKIVNELETIEYLLGFKPWDISPITQLQDIIDRNEKLMRMISEENPLIETSARQVYFQFEQTHWALTTLIKQAQINLGRQDILNESMPLKHHIKEGDITKKHKEG